MKNEKKKITQQNSLEWNCYSFFEYRLQQGKKTKTISLVRITTHSIFFLCFSALALGFVLKLDELDREI